MVGHFYSELHNYYQGHLLSYDQTLLDGLEPECYTAVAGVFNKNHLLLQHL